MATKKKASLKAALEKKKVESDFAKICKVLSERFANSERLKQFRFYLKDVRESEQIATIAMHNPYNHVGRVYKGCVTFANRSAYSAMRRDVRVKTLLEALHEKGRLLGLGDYSE